MSAQTGDENHPTHVRIALIFAASPSACASVISIILRKMVSIALRPSSRMFTSACSAHVGSSSPSARPSTLRAPLRPLAARSLHAHVGRKRRSSSAARSSTSPASSISFTDSSIDCLNAAACASPVFDSTVFRSSASSCNLPSMR
eukprot:7391797-Prymnesium_polylepis.1